MADIASPENTVHRTLTAGEADAITLQDRWIFAEVVNRDATSAIWARFALVTNAAETAS